MFVYMFLFNQCNNICHYLHMRVCAHVRVVWPGGWNHEPHRSFLDVETDDGQHSLLTFGVQRQLPGTAGPLWSACILPVSLLAFHRVFPKGHVEEPFVWVGLKDGNPSPNIM